MKKKFIFSLLVILLIVSMASFSLASLEENLEFVKTGVIGHELYGPIGTLFGDEEVNIYVTLDNGEELVVGLVTEDELIKSIEIGELSDPSLNVYTTEAVINGILVSSNSNNAIKSAFYSDEITYEGVGFFNTIKFAILSVFIDMIPEDDEEMGDELDSNEEPIFSPGGWDVEDNGEDLSDNQQDDNQQETEINNQIIENGNNEITDEEMTEPGVHVVKFVSDGFEPNEITINVGDTVRWENERTGNLNQGMVIGSRWCISTKSGVLEEGESFEFTFDRAGDCIIIDGIVTTLTMKVKIEGE